MLCKTVQMLTKLTMYSQHAQTPKSWKLSIRPCISLSLERIINNAHVLILYLLVTLNDSIFFLGIPLGSSGVKTLRVAKTYFCWSLVLVLLPRIRENDFEPHFLHLYSRQSSWFHFGRSALLLGWTDPVFCPLQLKKK